LPLGAQKAAALGVLLDAFIKDTNTLFAVIKEGLPLIMLPEWLLSSEIKKAHIPWGSMS